MPRSLLVLALLCSCLLTYSQNFIKGKVTDSTNTAVPFCALALLNASDSSLVKGNISDSTGNFTFDKIKSGNYFIKFNSVGFKPFSTATFSVDSLTQLSLPAQILKTEGVNLGEVSVAVYKPAIEFKNGMVVMNVENDLLAKGNTVLDLLKRIPGVTLDAQNNVSINGIGGVRFLIDDRLQQMPSPQVIDMLSGMSAEDISRIELMKNPPARYDAAGSGGLINIVTKKAKVNGYSGNFAFGVSQGKRLRAGPFISFNYKANKLSIFSSLNMGYWESLNVLTNDRTLNRNSISQTINTKGTNEGLEKVLAYNFGIEYDLSPKTILGVYVNGTSSDEKYDNKSTTTITNGTDFNYSKLQIGISDKYRISSPSYNISLLQKIDTLGGQIKFTAGFTNNITRKDKINSNRFYDDNNTEVAPVSVYNTKSDRNFKVYTQKLDLNKTFKNKVSLESGAKASFVNNHSSTQLDFSNQSTGLFTGDTTFYNIYTYKERILAAYITLSRSWDKIGLNLGLRAEDTDIHANDLKTGYTFKRHYFNLFPNASVNLNINKKNSLSVAYRYSIDRPHYDMLNPVRIFNEQMGYNVGNSELRPEYSHAITIEHNYNQFITQTIGLYRNIDRGFYYAYTPLNSKVLVDTIVNTPQRNEIYYSVFVQKRLKWYAIQAYAFARYGELQGSVEGQDISSSTYQLYFNVNQEFFLPKDFKIQLFTVYGSANRDGLQYYLDRSMFYLGVSKSFFDKKLSITLSAVDMLYKDYVRLTSNLVDQRQYYSDQADTRRFRININYRFGKMRIQQRLKGEDDNRLKKANSSE